MMTGVRGVDVSRDDALGVRYDVPEMRAVGRQHMLVHAPDAAERREHEGDAGDPRPRRPGSHHQMTDQSHFSIAENHAGATA
jgi:hypothetical protein